MDDKNTPVAWQCFDCIMEQWSVIDDAELAAARYRRDGEWIVRPLYASPPKAVTITDERNALLAEVISLIEDDMYGLGETDDVPERIAFNKALRRQINRITSRLIVSAALSSGGQSNG